MKTTSHTSHLAAIWLLLVTSLTGITTARADGTSLYVYDANNRVTQVSYSDGRQVNYAYDDVGNITAISTKQVAVPSVLVTSRLIGKVGAAITDWQIVTQSSSPVLSYNATGLPAGLKINKGNTVNADGKAGGVIYGTPTVGGRFTVLLTAKSAAGMSASTPLVVDISNLFTVLEDGFGLAGQFSGALDPSALSSNLGGALVVKTTATGSFTGTLTLGAFKHSFSGVFNGSTGVAAPITIVRKSPFTTNLILTLTLDLAPNSPTRGSITGTLSDGGPPEAVAAFREVWSKALPAAYFAGTKGSVYNTAFFLDSANLNNDTYPQGVSYARITVDQLGKAAVAGKLSDGTGITASTIVWPDGSVPIFLPLYTSKGSLAGTLQLGTGFAEDLVADNDITGSLTWKRPAITGKLYTSGFTTGLDATGGVYIAPAKGSRVLDLGSAASHVPIVLNLTKGGVTGTISSNLTVSTANLVTAITPNNNATKVIFTSTTGLVGGEFSIGTRKAKLEGLILPANPLNDSEAYGFFHLPGAATADPTLSGFFFIGRP
jgi:YD repeat-containing protein